jgi:type IV pilus assembly protein PilA
LVVVVAILGILALIAIPRLTGFQQDAKISADLATFETITKSISIAAINDDLTDDVTMVVASGVASFTESGTGEDADALFENAPSFKLKDNQAVTGVTWTIADGVVTAPTIDPVTGIID